MTWASSLGLALVLVGATAQGMPAPQQRRGNAVVNPNAPNTPIPVQVVPPNALNPQFGIPEPFTSGMLGGDSGMAPDQMSGGGTSSGGPASNVSDPPASRPGVEGNGADLPNADAKVSLRADDQDVRQVLALLGREAEVNILVAPGVEGRVQMDMENVTFRQALEAVLKLAGLGARQENGLVYVYSLTELDDLRGRERKPQVRVYHLNYIRASDLMAMINPAGSTGQGGGLGQGTFLSSIGTISTTPLSSVGLGGSTAGMGGGAGMAQTTSPTAGGGAASGIDTGGNSMAYHDVVIVRDYPENLAVIDEIVRRLDVQPPQVIIEAVILSVRLRDEQELGVNFSIIDNLERLALVSGSGAAINAAAGFTPARVLAAGVTRPGPGQLAPGYLTPNQGIKFGFVTDNISGFIRAVESFNKVNILASPRVMVLNKQRAEIQLGQRLGFRNTVTNLTSSLQTVEFLSVGTLLTLRPFVSNDGMIRLEIHPEKSTGALDSQGIPQTNTSELTTNILVPDGATIVIGGLIDDEDADFEEGTPGLNRLPLLGALFRTRRTTTAKNELIVLLTPRVIRQGGLPDPVAGLPPRGPLGIPNSGPMPGPPLAGPDEPMGTVLLGPPESFPVPAAPPASVPSAVAEPPTDVEPLQLPPLPLDMPATEASPPEPGPVSSPSDDVAPTDAAAVPTALERVAPAPPAMPQGGERGWVHTVRAGEDFAGIARDYYGTPAFGRPLWSANRDRVARPDALRAGQQIVVPPAAALDLAAGELPQPLTERERAATPTPRQRAPRVNAAPESRPGGQGLFRMFRRDRGPRSASSGSTVDTSLVPTSMHVEQTAPSKPRGYRPGDLTRALVQKLSGESPKPASDESLAVVTFRAQDAGSAAEPRGYRPGDLTRALMDRLKKPDDGPAVAPWGRRQATAVAGGDRSGRRGPLGGLRPVGPPVVTVRPRNEPGPRSAAEAIAPGR